MRQPIYRFIYIRYLFYTLPYEQRGEKKKSNLHFFPEKIMIKIAFIYSKMVEFIYIYTVYTGNLCKILRKHNILYRMLHTIKQSQNDY